MAEAAEKPRGATPPPPPGWGDDGLTAFLDHARDNQWATFHNKRDAVGRLIAIDAEFLKASRDWTNPTDELAACMLIRCHGAFRTSAGQAMAGQCAETYVQCRAMLEFAAYGVHIHREPSLATVWLNRHQDAASMKLQKDAFTHRKVVESVTAANRHAGQRFEGLYQRTIDYGGHPNEYSVTGNMKMVSEPGKVKLLTILLHEDGPALDLALRTVAQCGMASLEMLQTVFNDRFEILGINAAMRDLREGL